MTEHPFDPQTQIAGPESDEIADVRTGDTVPSPAALNAQYLDSSEGLAVSGLPTDEHPGDVEESRHRVEWDADTDEDESADRD